jgi:hypothetical protein
MTLEIVRSFEGHGQDKCGICKRANLPMIKVDGIVSCHVCISQIHRMLSNQKNLMQAQEQIELTY